jgi:hypothetical protein
MISATTDEDRKMLGDMLQSQVVWLGMLGELQHAVRQRDWETAARLAEIKLTYPQPYRYEHSTRSH